jgi:hypothetical protein
MLLPVRAMLLFIQAIWPFEGIAPGVVALGAPFGHTEVKLI